MGVNIIQKPSLFRSESCWRKLTKSLVELTDKIRKKWYYDVGKDILEPKPIGSSPKKGCENWPELLINVLTDIFETRSWIQ